VVVWCKGRVFVCVFEGGGGLGVCVGCVWGVLTLAVGCWRLAAGYWLLAIGYWRLAVGPLGHFGGWLG